VSVPATVTTEPSERILAAAIDRTGSPVGLGIWVGVAVGVGVGVEVGAGVGTGTSVGVGAGVGVGEGVGVEVGVGVGPGVGLGVWVGLTVGVGAGVGVNVELGAGVGLELGIALGVAEGVGIGRGVGAAARFCGNGGVLTTKSDALSFVSEPLPSVPPGRRSMLDPLAGAGAASPSTKVLVASPQPTASTGSPPIGLRATAPPVAANPPLYVASAMDEWIPETFATRRCRPGSRIVGVDQAAFRVTVPPLDVT
jgi:hypothetical protein